MDKTVARGLVKSGDTAVMLYAGELISMIEESRNRIWTAVNSELVSLYWSVGKWLSQKCATAQWGDKTILMISKQLAEIRPDLKGFSRPGLYRMRQFYEYYKDDEFVSPLVRQIDWTHHLIIMARAKSPEERRFYLEKCAMDRCSKRDLERLFDSSFYERLKLGEAAPHSPRTTDSVRAVIPDVYSLEFLDLPKRYREASLRDAIVSSMRDFIMELGGDFTFVGKEYPVKVGKSDFNIDLLFFNRALRCFFAVEVKTDEFEPSYLGQLQGYVAACDMVLNTPQENPAIGLLVCRGKNAPLAKCLLGKIDMPIGVSGYELLRKVPEDFKSQLPTIEEIEAELANMKNGNGV